jgi:bifunctional DNA primase/polymerase-like protein/primase-like protein
VATITQLAKTAIWYAGNGLPVFPLAPRTKNPVIPKKEGGRGYRDATTDCKQIQEWWKRWPDANIGLPTGLITRRLLLDADFRNMDPRFRDRDDLIEFYGPIPQTAEVITGTGDRHFHLRYAGGKVPKEIARGLELKSDGGYAVMPPSIHPNGNEYRFDGLDEKLIWHPGETPDWLLKLIEKGNTARSQQKADAKEAKWAEGERNTQLTRLAGKLRYAGLSEETIFTALAAANQRHCHPPLQEKEVRKIAHSVGQYPPGAGPTHPFYAEVNLDASEPSIELLNSLAIFGGRLHFTSLHRRGQMIVAKFAGDAEAIWPSTIELTSFSRAQAILADATDILLSTPPKAKVKAMWEPAVQLILRLAAKDKVSTDDARREEFGEILRSVWEQAGSPACVTPEQFVEILSDCRSHQRKPQEAPPPCCVWMAESSSWIYLPQLLAYLSTPRSQNRHHPWETVRSALLLLEFRLMKSLHRSANGKTAQASVWRGPEAILMD